MLIAIGVAVGAVAVGSAVWVMTEHPSTYDRSGGGCVNVTIASSMGGALEHACGATARDWCHTVYAQHDARAEAVQAQCRVAGILP